MAATHLYSVNSGWRSLAKHLGIQSENVLKRANLPGDLFNREKAFLNTQEYFRLWTALEEETADPTLALRMGELISVNVFDPPIFAALCSADLNTGLERIARYKKLIAPMVLHLDVGNSATTLELEWLEATVKPPVSLVAFELVFFVKFSRIATKIEITPLSISAPNPPEHEKDFSEFFGVDVQPGSSPRIAFKAEDARLPFIIANEKMWQFFEPELRKRLSEIDISATTTDRAKAALLELLPSGLASVTAVSRKLGTSTRTLQRHLKQEGKSFQGVLNETRESLARHYLRSSHFSIAEISFLLGFGDPNSFFRVFHSWTGTTPEQARITKSA